MTTNTQWLYRVHFDQYRLSVEVGVFDPERWEDKETKKKKGGMAFGFTAEAVCYSPESFGFGADSQQAQAGQGSTGLQSVADSQLRVDVYQQAVDIGRFIDDMVEKGESFQSIGAWLKENLSEDPKAPADGPFRFKGDS